jgi:hypothetical protein
LRILIRTPVLALILLWGCAEPTPRDAAMAKRMYLTAKNECVARYPSSLTLQSDCRSQAANAYIRPTYKYGDLMTRAQEQRRALAMRADRHEITRGEYNREVARSEAAISREEDRRNAAERMEARQGPIDRMIGTVSRAFR